MDYSETIRHAWNMFFLTVTLFVGWTAALAWMNGKRILWDYDSFPDEKADKTGGSH